MTKIGKILVPVDFSGTGEKVLLKTITMAKATRAEVVLVYVIEGPLGGSSSNFFGKAGSGSEAYEKEITQWAKEQLNDLKQQIVSSGVSKVSYVIEKGTAYKRIIALADKIKADIIIIGTHGVSGVREFVLGSNTFKVVSEAKCPVLSVQKHTSKGGFKDIILPFCDKPHSRESADFAIYMAELYGARLHVLGISLDKTATAMKKMETAAYQIVDAAEEAGVKCAVELIQGSFVAKLIFEYAKKNHSDLIVATSDLDKLAISEYIIGPVIQQIVNHSYIPVLSVHPIYNPNSESVQTWRFW